MTNNGKTIMTADPALSDLDAPHLPDLDKITSADIVTNLSRLEEFLLDASIDWGMRLVTAILILIIGWTIGSWARRRINRYRRFDPTLKDFLGRVAQYTVTIVAVVTVIGLFGIPLASLLAVLGAAGLAIGLALQGTLSNVASGVMLLVLRPFNVGDYIEFGNEGGTVRSLGLFGTELARSDNVFVFAPNSKIWGTEIRNYSRNLQRRQDIVVTIKFGDDLAAAFAAIERVLKNDPRILTQEGKTPVIVTDRIGDYGTDLIIRFWSSTNDYWTLRWDMIRAVKTGLEKAGITLPLTTRQINITPDAGAE
ncbi:MAG: mechanosensitive ion channel domain-containing protein [Micavibrio sp.]